ncbi:MAG: MFS transporter [Proteobacteria bacterium]|nr:MFS transporter [Pseudomonadota bacterium]
MPPGAPSRSSLRQLPRSIWALGFVSLFMDLSSETIHALLPVYLVTALGASMLEVGLIEGIAEATAMIVKVFSGALSDWLGKRKLLAVIGYGLAAITKPAFPLASSLSWIVAARFVDRIGKGIRGAPRDALVADLAPPNLRGAAFGLRQTLDTIGAFLGPLTAMALMWLSHDAFRLVFWIAIIPAFVSFALIVFVVKEPASPVAAQPSAKKLRWSDGRRLPATYWLVVAIASVLMVARFSEAFLVLKAQSVGIAVAFVPIVMVVMSAVYALTAYPAGVISDRFGRHGVLVAGTAVLIVADLVLAFAAGVIGALIGVALWGLHMGLSQGLLSAMVADTAPPDLRGTAFGLFNVAGGIAALLASLGAGGLWDLYGPAATFTAGAAVSLAGLAGLMLLPRRSGTKPS